MSFSTSYPITVFDSTLSQVAYIDDYEAASFERAIYEPGSFQISINRNKPNSEFLIRGYVIMWANDSSRVGIITTVNNHVDEQGKESETIEASGYELSVLFDRRVVIPPTGQASYVQDDDAETVMKNTILDQCGTGASTTRQFSRLTIATNQSRGATYLLSSQYRSLLDELRACALATTLGFTVSLDQDNKRFVFDVVVGINRQSNQTENPVVIFSTNYDGVRTSDYRDTDESYKNVAIAAGFGAASAKTVLSIYSGTEPQDVERREFYYNAQNVSTNGDITTAAQQRLTAVSFTKFFDSQPLAYSSFVYKEDYDVGDLVTLQDFNVTQNVKIIKVSESVSPGSYEIFAVYDKPTPDLTQQVKESVTTLQQNITISTPDIATLTPAGLTCSNNGATSVDVSAGVILDSTYKQSIRFTATVTGDLAATFGTSNGMLDTGSIASSTTYYLYVIKDPTKNKSSIIASTNSSSPSFANAPGYTLYRKLQAIRTNASSQLLTIPSNVKPYTDAVLLDSGNGHGGTNTAIRRYTNSTVVGTALLYADSVANGMSVTVLVPGIYSVILTDGNNATGRVIGVSVNSTQLAINISNITHANVVMDTDSASPGRGTCSIVRRFDIGDVVRSHDDGGCNNTGPNNSLFEMRRLDD